MTILIVDDGPLLRLIVRAALQEKGFETTEASDGTAGCEIIQESGDARIGGFSLALSAAESNPGTLILLMTGQHSKFVDEPIGKRVLEKPFLLHDLIRAVRSVQA